jgi:SAM-dependent methyltransferase
VISDYPCPICGSNRWKLVESFEYKIEDHRSVTPETRQSNSHGIADKFLRVLYLLRHRVPKQTKRPTTRLNEYQCLRRRVLFEVWFPGVEEVNLQSQLCLRCGFMSYKPRPTTEDVEAKYQFLKAMDSGETTQSDSSIVAAYLRKKRAQRTFESVREFKSCRKKMDILDYGGGDGRISLPFLEHGHESFVADYYNHQLPGVRKVADDINNLSPSLRFDAILCSHVLEHVGDPLDLVTRLRHFLAEDGVIYAEVPQEVWGGIRLEIDPVTHINFFTRRSFETLFRRAGYRILDSRLRVQLRQEVVCLLANKESMTAGKTSEVHPDQANDTVELLSPRRSVGLRRLFRLRIVPIIEINLLRMILRIRNAMARLV